MPSLKLLHFTGEPISSGGQEMFIINIFRHIDYTNLQMDVVSPYYCDNEVYRNDIVSRNGKLTCFGLPFAPGGFRTNIVKPLNEYLKNNKYDVIHIHSGSTSVLALVAVVARFNGIKKIIVHSHCTGFKKDWKYYFLKLFTFPMFKYAKPAYLACSKEAAYWKFSNNELKNVIVVNNGIDLNRFAFNEEMRQKVRCELGINELCLGHVGRFSEQKNQEFLLDILSSLKDKGIKAKLLLVGDGEQREEFEKRAANAGLKDSVIITGAVSNVEDYMDAMDIFLFPSRWEGLGLVGVEAQANGMPVIASSNVPRDMAQTCDVKFLDLTVETWVNQILDTNTERKDYKDQITSNGYSVNHTVAVLKKIYV